MDKIIKIHLFLCLAFLTSCDWFSSNKSSNTSVPDSYSAEFELTEEVPTLTACQGTRTIDYRVKTCFKNGTQTELSNCSNISKNPLEVKSPEGSRTFPIEGEESNLIGDKIYSCDEGESLSEEKVDVTCSDSRYVRYSLNDNGIMDSCKPYPIYIENEVVTDSIGTVFYIRRSLDNLDGEVIKVDFPKVIKATIGTGGICGYSIEGRVYCQKKNVYGGLVLRVDEITELSRNIPIEKFYHKGNTICVIYEDKEVGCTQALPYNDDYTGTQGAAGRGLEPKHPTNITKVVFERTSPLIPEYFGAIDISLLGRYLGQVSCALFQDNSIKCSGKINYLSSNEDVLTFTPIPSYNKKLIDGEYIHFRDSYCPFSQIQGEDCFYLNENTGNIGFLNKELGQIGPEEFIVGTYRHDLNEIINYYVTSKGFLYTYSFDYGFELYNNLKIDQRSLTGVFIISNKKLYNNNKNPVHLKLY